MDKQGPTYSTGNYIQHPEINHNEKEHRNKKVCVCVCVYVCVCVSESLCCIAEINTIL